MRDIYYYNSKLIGSKKWVERLNEYELKEWKWMSKKSNLKEIEQYQKEFGVENYWHLGRLLYVLNFPDDDYTKDYARFEDTIWTTPIIEKEEDCKQKILHLEYEKSNLEFMKEMGHTPKFIDEKIEYYQKAMEHYRKVTKGYKELFFPKKYDSKTAVLRRSNMVFLQLEGSGKGMVKSIKLMYDLFIDKKFDDYDEYLREIKFNEFTNAHYNRLKVQRSNILKSVKQKSK